MIKQIIDSLLRKRHYWRFVGFDELSELYTSTMLRSMGLSLIGLFVPIYLYIEGYSLPDVFLFMGAVFASRSLFDFVTAYIIARIGPKHTILLSNIVQIVFLGLLLSVTTLHWPLLLLAVVWGPSLSMFFVSYHVDFSKIIHANHGGKEMGFMVIAEKLGASLGPVVGGVVATVFGAEYTIAAAIVLFTGAVIPLLLTAEPTRLHQKINYRGLPIKKLQRDFVSYFSQGVDAAASLSMWPLYAAVVILTVNTYAAIGLAASLGVVASVAAAKFIGQVVDRDRGLMLFNWSVGANTILHAVRPFVNSFSGVLLVNISNEALTPGYRLPYTKGMYARAEDLPGFRIAYISLMEAVLDAGKASIWLIAWTLALWVSPVEALIGGFVLAAIASSLMTVQNFPALIRRRLTFGGVY